MYLSSPMARFPELADDLKPFHFMVVPREWTAKREDEGREGAAGNCKSLSF
jgi:hypothetical protein